VKVEILPALYECRLLSLMVARVVLRRSVATRQRTLLGSLERGFLPGFPGCRPGYAAWLVKCRSVVKSRIGFLAIAMSGARDAAGSKQSAASLAISSLLLSTFLGSGSCAVFGLRDPGKIMFGSFGVENGLGR